ncbi:hypothetical protein VOLCADRAFT_89818 [Volvox carteri f. nagariensis]|uniref:Uncharacterized protein n=1 Tax=Volvox carteri f. nagariensis TaxID=3068 RepID=D8TSQ8_VOLCA|nr:uncharacterized protein VOLCADRAFT_89818 [Volvox carteri f. nagariensis]EFJ49413.1 hypothetical protein VOLCADRAFT_89818 [Volvox carteri f. nagariensis]|eukprot:XP_002949394.1 hypothetical protein VOLCADRAFT_89818 [Volvox carteri f. nagariensis]
MSWIRSPPRVPSRRRQQAWPPPPPAQPQEYHFPTNAKNPYHNRFPAVPGLLAAVGMMPGTKASMPTPTIVTVTVNVQVVTTMTSTICACTAAAATVGDNYLSSGRRCDGGGVGGGTPTVPLECPIYPVLSTSSSSYIGGGGAAATLATCGSSSSSSKGGGGEATASVGPLWREDISAGRNVISALPAPLRNHHRQLHLQQHEGQQQHEERHGPRGSEEQLKGQVRGGTLAAEVQKLPVEDLEGERLQGKREDASAGSFHRPPSQVVSEAGCRTGCYGGGAVSSGGCSTGGSGGGEARQHRSLTGRAPSSIVDRYGSLLVSSAGWRCTELYDINDTLLLSSLSSRRCGTSGGGGRTSAESTLSYVTGAEAPPTPMAVVDPAALALLELFKSKDMYDNDDGGARGEEVAAGASSVPPPPSRAASSAGLSGSQRRPVHKHSIALASSIGIVVGGGGSGSGSDGCSPVLNAACNTLGTQVPRQEPQQLRLSKPSPLLQPRNPKPQHRLAVRSATEANDRAIDGDVRVVFGSGGGGDGVWGAALEAMLERVVPRTGYYTPPSQPPVTAAPGSAGAVNGGAGGGSAASAAALASATAAGSLVERSGAYDMTYMQRCAGRVRAQAQRSGRHFPARAVPGPAAATAAALPLRRPRRISCRYHFRADEHLTRGLTGRKTELVSSGCGQGSLGGGGGTENNGSGNLRTPQLETWQQQQPQQQQRRTHDAAEAVALLPSAAPPALPTGVSGNSHGDGRDLPSLPQAITRLGPTMQQQQQQQRRPNERPAATAATAATAAAAVTAPSPSTSYSLEEATAINQPATSQTAPVAEKGVATTATGAITAVDDTPAGTAAALASWHDLHWATGAAATAAAAAVGSITVGSSPFVCAVAAAECANESRKKSKRGSGSDRGPASGMGAGSHVAMRPEAAYDTCRPFGRGTSRVRHEQKAALDCVKVVTGHGGANLAAVASAEPYGSSKASGSSSSGCRGRNSKARSSDGDGPAAAAAAALSSADQQLEVKPKVAQCSGDGSGSGLGTATATAAAARAVVGVPAEVGLGTAKPGRGAAGRDGDACHSSLRGDTGTTTTVAAGEDGGVRRKLRTRSLRAVLQSLLGRCGNTERTASYSAGSTGGCCVPRPQGPRPPPPPPPLLVASGHHSNQQQQQHQQLWRIASGGGGGGVRPPWLEDEARATRLALIAPLAAAVLSV